MAALVRLSACLCAASLTLHIGLRRPALAGQAGVQAPAFVPGDAWVFDDKTEKGATGFEQHRVDMTVERLDGPLMVVGLKPDGAPGNPIDHVVGQDWSQRRVVDGEQTTTTRPFSFPLRPGKTWSVDYVDPTRRGNQLSNHVRRTYTVIGWEDVTVPAGAFHAVKVEAKGVDEATLVVPNVAVAGAETEEGSGSSFSHVSRGGRSKLVRATYAALYYVPELRNYAKSVEEQYDTDNMRVIRTTLELVSYKLVPSSSVRADR